MAPIKYCGRFGCRGRHIGVLSKPVSSNRSGHPRCRAGGECGNSHCAGTRPNGPFKCAVGGGGKRRPRM